LRTAYLEGQGAFRVQALPQTPVSDALPPARRQKLALVLGLGVAATLLTAAALLWASYGTTVFFEMVAAGIAACF
jgi:hypothetical protein